LYALNRAVANTTDLFETGQATAQQLAQFSRAGSLMAQKLEASRTDTILSLLLPIDIRLLVNSGQVEANCDRSKLLRALGCEWSGMPSTYRSGELPCA